MSNFRTAEQALVAQANLENKLPRGISMLVIASLSAMSWAILVLLVIGIWSTI
jgi:hypothetical protein